MAFLREIQLTDVLCKANVLKTFMAQKDLEVIFVR